MIRDEKIDLCFSSKLAGIPLLILVTTHKCVFKIAADTDLILFYNSSVRAGLFETCDMANILLNSVKKAGQ